MERMMIRRVLFLLSIALFSSSAFAQQVSVTGSASASDVVSNLVGSGTSVTTSNISSSGNAGALGTYTGGNTAFGLPSGVIISNGNASSASSPRTTNASTDFAPSGV